MFEQTETQQLLERYLVLRGKARAQEFVTVTEAADLIGYSRSAILKLINEDKISFVRVGRRFQILRVSLVAFLQRRAET